MVLRALDKLARFEQVQPCSTNGPSKTCNTPPAV